MSFETASDTKSEYYRDHSYFPIESNLHYRYTSTEDLLNDMDVIKQMIQDHHTNQVPRLEVLDEYAKGRNRTIKQNKRRKEEEKANHRPANNFAKVASQFDVGYNTGIPIKTILDDDEEDMITDFNEFNDANELNSELWLDSDKFGRAYELQYRTEDFNDHIVISNVFTTFVVYDMSPKRKPILAVRYPKLHFGNRDDEVSITLYTPDEIIHYAPTSLSGIKFFESKREKHAYKKIPVTETQPNRYRQGLYEDVISLIDLYDSAQADTANYMSDLANATLVISGDVDSANMSTDDLVKQKKANMLILESGVDVDGKQTQLAAGYIYKQYDVNGTEAYKKRLVQDIHKYMNVPDLTDENFAGVQSGESMKYKLSGYSQMAASKQRAFAKHLKERYRLLYNVKKEASEVTEVDIDALQVQYTPNIPQSIHEELDVLVGAGAEFSQQTLLEQASFVDDAEDEMKRVKEENMPAPQTDAELAERGMNRFGEMPEDEATDEMSEE